jgi:hypothetical protein
MDIRQVKDYISSQPQTSKIYLGADSECLSIDGVDYADYTICVVVHIEGNHGGKVFGEVIRERIYDKKKNKPAMRLMTEVFKVAELFNELSDVLEDRHVEVHLDLSHEEDKGSSCVVQQAIGYIRGTCNVTPITKPNAWAATGAADRLKSILSVQKKVA